MLTCALMICRPARGAYIANGYASRDSRSRSLSPHAMTPPHSAPRPGRFPAASLQAPGGRGRGMPPSQARFTGMGALGRAHQTAALAVDQLVPQLQMQSSLIHSQVSAFTCMPQSSYKAAPVSSPAKRLEKLATITNE